jgi:hypothetical protein
LTKIGKNHQNFRAMAPSIIIILLVFSMVLPCYPCKLSPESMDDCGYFQKFVAKFQGNGVDEASIASAALGWHPPTGNKEVVLL